jgi:hypothetical protein
MTIPTISKPAMMVGWASFWPPGDAMSGMLERNGTRLAGFRVAAQRCETVITRTRGGDHERWPDSSSGNMDVALALRLDDQ